MEESSSDFDKIAFTSTLCADFFFQISPGRVSAGKKGAYVTVCVKGVRVSLCHGVRAALLALCGKMRRACCFGSVRARALAPMHKGMLRTNTHVHDVLYLFLHISTQSLPPSSCNYSRTVRTKIARKTLTTTRLVCSSRIAQRANRVFRPELNIEHCQSKYTFNVCRAREQPRVRN